LIYRELSWEISILILNDGGVDIIPVDPIPVIQYLDLIHGFRCIIYYHIVGIEGSIKCHYRKEYRDPETPSQRGIPLGMNSFFPLFLLIKPFFIREILGRIIGSKLDSWSIQKILRLPLLFPTRARSITIALTLHFMRLRIYGY
jgi:hypothetical protein